MKELEKHIAEKTEQHALKPIKKELKRVSVLRPKGGQRVFELNLATGIINEVSFDVKNEAVDYENAVNNDFSVTKKLEGKETCIYCCALNAKNADKHFMKKLKRLKDAQHN